MTEAERIELFRSYCQFSYYPPALTEAACDYLAGQGSLPQVRQYAQPGLRNIFTISPSLLNAWQFGKHASISQGSLLDALDCRLLDVCGATNQIWECLTEVGDSLAIQEALEYLMTQGMSPHTLLQGITGATHLLTGLQGQPTPFAQALLQVISGRLNDLLKQLSSGSAYQPGKPPPGAAKMVRLLLAAEPPAIEQAWGIVEELASKAEPAYVSELGQCACLLLNAAPERFTSWARQLVGPGSHASLQSRLLVLRALLEHSPTQPYDLIAEVLRAPFPEYNWEVTELRRNILDTLYRTDATRALPLIGEAACSKTVFWLTGYALQLLTQAPFDQAHPYLQRCVAECGMVDASQALKTLLSQQWEGRQEYVLSLLAHHAKRIRKEAIVWLAQQGEAVIDGMTPFLTHADPAIRLSAIEALAAVGGQRALAILAARLHQEKTPRVRQAIFEVVGLPAAQQYPGPLSKETLIARAEATLQYVYKPTPRWFVVAEVPAPLWANNEPVPPAVLRYLLYRQSFVQAPATLDNEVSQALTLLNHSTAGSLATYLFKGWIEQGCNLKEAWCLPLICTMGDDTLIPALSLRVEDWYRDSRRKLAIRIIQALPLFERQAAIQELRSLAKRLKRGIVKTAAKETLAAVAP